jgi:hypothetical protein
MMPAFRLDFTAHGSCQQNGCQIVMANQILGQAQKAMEQARVMEERTQAILNRQGKKEMTVSAALWCDQGGHAFSERDPERQEFTRASYDADGHRVESVFSVCGSCGEKSGFRTAPALAPPDETR